MSPLFNATLKSNDYKPLNDNIHPLADYIRRYISLQFPGDRLYCWDLKRNNPQTDEAAAKFHSASCVVRPHMIPTITPNELRKNGELIDFGLLRDDGTQHILVTASASHSISTEDDNYLKDIAKAASDVINLHYLSGELPLLVDFHQRLDECKRKLDAAAFMSGETKAYRMTIAHDGETLRIHLNEHQVAHYPVAAHDKKLEGFIQDWSRLADQAGIQHEIKTTSHAFDEEAEESFGTALGA